LGEALRQSLRTLALASIIAVATISAACAPARAQGKLDAQYSATLAGIPIGKGSWVIDIADKEFSATANGKTTGLLRIFAGGEGTSAAHGTMQGGRLVSTVYSSVIISSKKKDEIRVTTANGNVKEFTVDPPADNDSERLPITEAHQRGVLDPMTATLMHVAGAGDLLSPEACKHTVSIFDGRLRYDLQFVFKRMDTVKADKGYAGPVVVCAVYFTPIAGYVPSRAAIKYIAKLRDIEIWMAPIAGTRVLVPFRLETPTPIGHAVLEATQFVSVASPTRASANGTKTTQ
jgi:hypothetical protein